MSALCSSISVQIESTLSAFYYSEKFQDAHRIERKNAKISKMYKKKKLNRLNHHEQRHCKEKNVKMSQIKYLHSQNNAVDGCQYKRNHVELSVTRWKGCTKNILLILNIIKENTFVYNW